MVLNDSKALLYLHLHSSMPISSRLKRQNIWYLDHNTCGEIDTHLATAVKASSTLRPDLALVSMKGTPNSCRGKAMTVIGSVKSFFYAQKTQTYV